MFGLRGVRDVMVEVAAGFDPARLSPGACAEVVEVAAAIEKVAATIKALAAARVAGTELWRAGGDRSAAHALARATGTSVKDAAEVIASGGRVAGLPALDAAARRGEVSASQVAAIVGAGVDDVSAARLLGEARRGSLAELRDACLRARAATSDLEATHRRIKAERRLRTWTDGEGAWNLAVRDTPEVGAEVMAALEPIRDRLFRTARAEGRREPSEAYAADALVELARGSASSNGRGTKAKIVVRVDWDSLVRGTPIEGETCEIAGVGPVPVAVVETMMASGDAFLTAVVTKGVDVVNVAHLGRRPTVFQETAMQWRDPTCCVDGCGAVAHLEIDHRVDWSTSKITLLHWLDKLCSHHHDKKTYDGWALVHGIGKRQMVPPDDPRHPGSMKRHPRRTSPQARAS